VLSVVAACELCDISDVRWFMKRLMSRYLSCCCPQLLQVSVYQPIAAIVKTKHLPPLAFIATLIASASASVTMDWVTIGNAGNAAHTTGYGAVGYSYQIGKYEVTNAQYGSFLNAAAQTDNHGLYNENMSSYGISRSGNSGNYTYSVTTVLANRPVVYVSWFDAARFANWMMNGQGSGSTEIGAYTLNGQTILYPYRKRMVQGGVLQRGEPDLLAFSKRAGQHHYCGREFQFFGWIDLECWLLHKRSKFIWDL
jgi:hypothetical protein